MVRTMRPRERRVNAKQKRRNIQLFCRVEISDISSPQCGLRRGNQLDLSFSHACNY